MENLFQERGPMRFVLVSIEEMRHYTRMINLLLGTQYRKGGAKSKLMRQSNVSYSKDGDVLVDELTELGYLKKTDLRGDRAYYTITPKGSQVIKEWHSFTALFEEERT